LADCFPLAQPNTYKAHLDKNLNLILKKLSTDERWRGRGSNNWDAGASASMLFFNTHFSSTAEHDAVVTKELQSHDFHYTEKDLSLYVSSILTDDAREKYLTCMGLTTGGLKVTIEHVTEDFVNMKASWVDSNGRELSPIYWTVTTSKKKKITGPRTLVSGGTAFVAILRAEHPGDMLITASAGKGTSASVFVPKYRVSKDPPPPTIFMRLRDSRKAPCFAWITDPLTDKGTQSVPDGVHPLAGLVRGVPYQVHYDPDQGGGTFHVWGLKRDGKSASQESSGRRKRFDEGGVVALWDAHFRLFEDGEIREDHSEYSSDPAPQHKAWNGFLVCPAKRFVIR